MNISKSKECVGRIALVVTTASTLTLGGLLYNSNIEISESSRRLDEAKNKIVQLEDETKSLKKSVDTISKEKSVVITEKEKLEKDVADLKKENKSIKEKNKDLQSSNDKLKQEVSNLKKTKVATDKSSSPVSTKYSNWKVMTVEATGYSLFSDELGSDGTPYTATGTYPTAGRTIAVDPRVIPYGTEVYIPAMGGVFIAEDTGGMIKGNKIDIYMNHGDIARQWGRQSIQIYVNL